MNIANVIRNLIIRAKAEGVDQTAQSLKGLAQAHDQAGKSAQAHATASETSARRQLSMEQAFERLERRFNTTARAQSEFSRVQTQVNAAVAQNPALQARANEILALAAAHYGRAGQAQTAFAAGMRALQDTAIATSSRLGVLGSALIAIGPAGIAAGAGLGLAAYGLSRFVGAVNDLADRAGKLVDFSQTTGLTTDALQGLIKAGAQVGVEADKVGTSIERFTVQLQQLRSGSGDLYDAVRQVDKGLAEQLASAQSTAQAFDILSLAYQRAEGNQRNLIAKGAFGQRNIGAGRLLGETADAGGIETLIQRSRELGAIDEKRLKTLDQIGDRLNELRRSSIDRFLIRGAEHELKVAEDFYGILNKIQDWVDSFAPSSAWEKFIEELNRLVFPKITAMLEQRAMEQAPQQQPAPQNDLPNRLGNIGNQALPGMDFGIAKYKEFIGILGAAATPAEQLKLKILELGQAALRGGASQETYNRALAALNAASTAGLRERIAQQQFENSLIGKSAVDTARLRAEWDALSTARQAAYAAGKSEDEINDLLNEQSEEVQELIGRIGRLAEEHARLTEAATSGSQRRSSAANQEAEAWERAKAEAEAFARAIAFIPAGNYTLGQNIFQGKQGYSQFRPEGYQSNLDTIVSGRPARGIVDDILSKGGTLEMAIEALQAAPASTERDKLIEQLNKQLEELRKSTDALNSTMTDILSPLYGTDPRTMHLGYRADTGVYRPSSMLTNEQIGAPPGGFPGYSLLPGMATGGSLTVPGGYSSVDNALLPVASGERIRVSRDDDRPNITINAPITITGMEGDRSDARETGFQMSQALARVVQQGLAGG